MKDFETKIKKKDGSTADCYITASRNTSAEGMRIVRRDYQGHNGAKAARAGGAGDKQR